MLGSQHNHSWQLCFTLWLRAGGSDFRLYDGSDLKDLSINEMVGARCFGCLSGPPGVYLLDFFCSGIQFDLLLSPYPCYISLLYLDLNVLGDGALIS